MSKFDNISNQDLEKLINNWIKSERDRKILYRRLIDGICYDALAEEFNLTYDRIKQIVYKQQNILFKHIPEPEYMDSSEWITILPY